MSATVILVWMADCVATKSIDTVAAVFQDTSAAFARLVCKSADQNMNTVMQAFGFLLQKERYFVHLLQACVYSQSRTISFPSIHSFIQLMFC